MATIFDGGQSSIEHLVTVRLRGLDERIRRIKPQQRIRLVGKIIDIGGDHVLGIDLVERLQKQPLTIGEPAIGGAVVLEAILGPARPAR